MSRGPTLFPQLPSTSTRSAAFKFLPVIFTHRTFPSGMRRERAFYSEGPSNYLSGTASSFSPESPTKSPSHSPIKDAGLFTMIFYLSRSAVSFSPPSCPVGKPYEVTLIFHKPSFLVSSFSPLKCSRKRFSSVFLIYPFPDKVLRSLSRP